MKRGRVVGFSYHIIIGIVQQIQPRKQKEMISSWKESWSNKKYFTFVFTEITLKNFFHL